MKKLITVLSCILITTIAFAKSKNNLPAKTSIEKKPGRTDANFIKKELKKDDCTVSITITANIYFLSISATCAANATSCDAAATQAATCAQTAINKVKQLLMK
jgi:hypothetical protein